MLNELLGDEDGKVHTFEVFMVLLVLITASAGLVLFALGIGFGDSRLFASSTACFLLIAVMAFFGKRGAYRTDT